VAQHPTLGVSPTIGVVSGGSATIGPIIFGTAGRLGRRSPPRHEWLIPEHTETFA